MSSTLQLQHLWGDSPQQGSMSRHRAPRSAPLTQDASRFLPPHLLLLVSMFSVQLGAALAKSLFPALGSMGTVFLRLTLASLMLLPARILSVLLSLEPVVGALIVLLVLGETMGLRAIIAMALVVVASGGISFGGKGDNNHPGR